MIEIIKQIVQNSLSSRHLCDLVYATIITIKPLSIKIDTNQIIQEPFVSVDKLLLKHELMIEIDGEKKQIKVENELAANDQVICIKKEGGQLYHIIGKR